ncbi:glycosyltransferase family 4 protein [Actinomadura fibrosa]
MISQFKSAKKAGFKIDLALKGSLRDESSNIELLEEIDSESRIYSEDSLIPYSRIKKLFRATLIILTNIFSAKIFFKLFRNYGVKAFDYLIQFSFFKKFNKHQIIHIQYGTNAKPLDILKKYGLIKNKIIISFHGHDAFFPINNKIFDRDYYKDIFEFADLIIANTPYLKTQLLKIGCPEERIKLLPVGVDTKFFNPTPIERDSETFSMITIGRLSKVKGHVYAIEAVQRLRKKGYNVKLTIIGEGPLRIELQSRIRDSELQDIIHLVGRKNQQEIKSFLMTSDIYISTSMPVRAGRRETQGLANLEAQACGLPIVAFNSGGVKYTLLELVTGFLVDEGDVDALTEKIERLMLNQDLRKKMGLSAVNFVQNHFNQDSLDKEWENIYKSLL